MRPRLALIGMLIFMFAACGGGEPEGDSGRLIGVVPGDADTDLEQVAETTTIATATSDGGVASCPADEVCPIEVVFTGIPLDAPPSSISLEGDRAWLALPDEQLVVEVDLAEMSVVRSIPVGAAATDVVPGAGSLWVVTYDFSFGPMLRVDPADGPVLAEFGDLDGKPTSVVVLEDSVWAVTDGLGKVLRVDLASNEVTDSVGGNDASGGAGETSIVAVGGSLWAINEAAGSVMRIDAASRAIQSTIDDLGYLEEPSGESTSVLAEGPKALAATDNGVWVLSDVANPGGDPNVVGGGALFLLDPDSGSVMRRIDLIFEPAFGRPGLAITDGAAWYIDFNTGFPVRVDLETERQTYVRLDNASAVGVVTDGNMVWVAAQALFDTDLVIGFAESDAAAATRALDE